jgi:hypothetical protein
MYSEAINRAATVLLAMRFRPNLKDRLLGEITTAVRWRGGQIDDYWLAKYELRAVCDEVAEIALAMLSVMPRGGLSGIADEMDMEFGDNLRSLLFSFSSHFPTLCA